MGQKVLSGENEKRTFCCGLTLEVFLRGYNQWIEKNGGEEAARLKVSDWANFKRLWFVVDLNGPGPSDAAEAYQLGRKISKEEVLPGDFVQIWRTPKPSGKVSGHSVVFLEWVLNDKGEKEGFKYWSTQPGTGGIHENTEMYGPGGGISRENTYFARIDPDLPLKENLDLMKSSTNQQASD